MATYFKIENNTVIDAIVAESSFVSNLTGNWVQAQDGFTIGDIYENNNFSKAPSPQLTEQDAREWRNQELRATDFIVPLTDFPNHAAWITYRQELRDWTATEDFPNTKPTAPAEL